MFSDNTTTRLFSAGLGFIPILGSVKSLAESISGKDIITGSKLSGVDRSLSAVGAIPGFQGLKYLAKGTKFGSKVYKTVETVENYIKLPISIKSVFHPHRHNNKCKRISFNRNNFNRTQ